MGVKGLWTLIEPAGKPIPLESLQNKILAIGNTRVQNFIVDSTRKT
jgi:DNA excision repair protein ERCC-5